VIATPSDDDGATEMAAEEPAGPPDILPLLASADPAAGETLTRQCISCHSFEEGGPTKTGPNLYDIVNYAKGARDFRYSDTLTGMGGEGQVWDYAALNGFLYNPGQYAPGTRMSYRGIRDDQDRANLIAYLRSLSGSPAPLP